MRKKNDLGGFDGVIERINRRLGLMLGRKHKKLDRQSQPPKTTNHMFVILIVAILLLLWWMTGFYYLRDKESGIILSNGRIADVVSGMKVGFTWPYPFGDIVVIDNSVSDLMTLNQDDLGAAGYVTLAKNLVPIKVVAKFNYQVIDPQQLFVTTVLKDNNLDDMVRWQMQLQFRAYIMQNYADDMVRDNLTIIANDIRDNANMALKSIGVKIVKVEINSFSSPSGTLVPVTSNTLNQGAVVQMNPSVESVVIAESSVTVPSYLPQIAQMLLQQANQYQVDHLAEATVNINKFNQLLPKYKLDPNGVVEQMYFEMLSAVPEGKSNAYPLLGLKLSDLMNAAGSSFQSVISLAAQPARGFERRVTRARNLDGRK